MPVWTVVGYMQHFSSLCFHTPLCHVPLSLFLSLMLICGGVANIVLEVPEYMPVLRALSMLHEVVTIDSVRAHRVDVYRWALQVVLVCLRGCYFVLLTASPVVDVLLSMLCVDYVSLL